MSTVRDLATRALQDLGVLGAGQVADSGQAQGALDALNAIRDQYAAENLLINSQTRTTATLTASQPSFTVGTGGNINITRPVFIDRVAYVDNSVSPAVEYDLGDLLTDEQYQAIPMKSLTSTRPTAAYYNPTFPLGTLIPWPIPTDASLLWAIYHGAAGAQFASINDVLSLPPGYLLMLITNLAVRLAPSYEREPRQSLVREAAISKAVVMRANERKRVLQFPPEALIGSAGGYWDIRTGR